MGRSRAGGLDGILVVAKPAGPSSHDVVALVRRLSATRRVGHGGTLDPFATGVLPLFLGRATRLVEYHIGAPKAYRATICFGSTSTTDDLEGELVPVEAALDRVTVERALGAFRGPIEQVPPAFSAVHVGGRRAYALARAGQVPELRPRRVTISRLELVSWDDTDPARPIAVVEVGCSAGTYIRSLARDLGAAVGSGAYLGALTRTSSGGFTLDDAIPLERVRAAAADAAAAFRGLLRPIDDGLDDWPTIHLTDEQATAIVRGQAVRMDPAPDGETPDGGTPLRLIDPAGRFVAVGGLTPAGRIRPTKVLVDRPAASVTV